MESLSIQQEPVAPIGALKGHKTSLAQRLGMSTSTTKTGIQSASVKEEVEDDSWVIPATPPSSTTGVRKVQASHDVIPPTQQSASNHTLSHLKRPLSPTEEQSSASASTPSKKRRGNEKAQDLINQAIKKERQALEEIEKEDLKVLETHSAVDPQKSHCRVVFKPIIRPPKPCIPPPEIPGNTKVFRSVRLFGIHC